MTDATHVLQKIRREAEQNGSTIRWVEACAPGDEIRQGDIYLYPIDAPQSLEVPHWGRQLAPGTTTGSRHVVEGEADLYSRHAPGVLEGPYVHAHERVVLTHPEHAHVSLPAGWYEVRYQRDYEAPYQIAHRVQRVLD